MAEHRTVVLDIGSSALRIGFAANDAVIPKLTVPMIVGVRRNQEDGMASGDRRLFGLEAVKYRAVCDLSRPVEDGKIRSVEDLRYLLEGCASLLGITWSQVAVVLTEPVASDKSHRQELAQLFLDELKAQSLLIMAQSIPALFAAGATSGIVIDSGEERTTVCAVVDGIGIPSTLSRSNVGGSAVTQLVSAFLMDTAQHHAHDHAQQLKEAMCYVRTDPSDVGAEMEYRLPDGSKVRLGKERHLAPEIIFSRSPVGARAGPHLVDIPTSISTCVQNCDQELHQYVLNCVVSAGGSAMFRGFEERLQQEISHIQTVAPETRALFRVVSSPVAPCDRTWAGSAMFASLSSSRSLFITAKDIGECGLQAASRHRLAPMV